jgi:hypothetical protein
VTRRVEKAVAGYGRFLGVPARLEDVTVG